MISILRKKLPHIEWRMGDSDYEGFYVLGRTMDGIKIKITKDDEIGKYLLGIYSYGTNNDYGRVRRLVVSHLLKWRVKRAIGTWK
jgi:hypothetical protein